MPCTCRLRGDRCTKDPGVQATTDRCRAADRAQPSGTAQPTCGASGVRGATRRRTHRTAGAWPSGPPPGGRCRHAWTRSGIDHVDAIGVATGTATRLGHGPLGGSPGGAPIDRRCGHRPIPGSMERRAVAEHHGGRRPHGSGGRRHGNILPMEGGTGPRGSFTRAGEGGVQDQDRIKRVQWFMGLMAIRMAWCIRWIDLRSHAGCAD